MRPPTARHVTSRGLYGEAILAKPGGTGGSLGIRKGCGGGVLRESAAADRMRLFAEGLSKGRRVCFRRDCTYQLLPRACREGDAVPRPTRRHGSGPGAILRVDVRRLPRGLRLAGEGEGWAPDQTGRQ